MQIDDFFPDQNRHVRYLLGLYLKRKRQELKLSASQMALQASVSLGIYRKIENGQIKLSTDVFNRLQRLLDLDTHELLEIGQISSILYINELSQALTPNYPT